MDINLKKIGKIALFIAIPLIVGGISALITMNQMELFETAKMAFSGSLDYSIYTYGYSKLFLVFS